MGERKVLNKYFPPDFDPSIIPRKRKTKEDKLNVQKVRMMLPMSIRCSTCGNYISKGTKFNSRKEDVQGEEGKYLGIQIFRFYFHCTRCGSELTMKTDPKNSDYEVEFGCTRNYEPWRDADATKEEYEEQRRLEEEGNAMKALENRTLDSKQEMDILAALDEMKSLNARHATVTTDDALKMMRQKQLQELEQSKVREEEEDEALVKSIVFGKADQIVRLPSDDEDEEPSKKKQDVKQPPVQHSLAGSTAGVNPLKKLPVKFSVKPKAAEADKAEAIHVPAAKDAAGDGGADSDGSGGGALGLIGNYGSESD